MSSRAPRLRRVRRPRLRGDRGSATVEFALGVPILMLLLAFAVQVGLWALGDLAARQAANHALQISRVVGGTEAAGLADAATLLEQLGGRFVVDPRITVTRTATTTTVTVRGRARAIIPGLQPVIVVTVHAPTERSGP